MVKVEFIARNKNVFELFDKPHVCSHIYPEWLKKIPTFYSNKIIDQNGDPTETVKKCMPFFDAMTFGYHIPLPCDVWVDKTNNDFNIQWAADEIKVVSKHDERQYDNEMIPEEFEKIVFKWINQWIVKTPKNWSCLFTQPIHQDKVPFQCFTGLVDTDKFPRPVNIPFVVQKNFSGLIPKGTPIVQIIPIKREKFVSSYSFDDGRYSSIWQKTRNVFFDRYKRFFRQPKEFVNESDLKPKCPFSFLHKPKD
jgi:hypothetical protein